MRRSLAIPLVALFALPACRVHRVPLDEQFPDLAELRTTRDPEDVRARLLRSQPPSTPEHHEKLFQLLRSEPHIDDAHLVLLVRAVAMPATGRVQIGAQTWTWALPGDGDAAVLDRLLLEGCERLDLVSRRWSGELLGLAQTPSTLRAIADRVLPTLDDGSPEALRALLDGMPRSPMLQTFLTDVLAADGKLEGERLWLAFDQMSFDDRRIALLEGLTQRGLKLGDDEFVRVMRAFTFDDGRSQAVELLAPRLEVLSFQHAMEALDTFSFDDGRIRAFTVLGSLGSLHLTDGELVRAARACTFDDGKLATVRALKPRLSGVPTSFEARELLDAFTFDSDRVATVQTMAERWKWLPKTEHGRVLDAFTFASSREQAAALLN